MNRAASLYFGLAAVFVLAACGEKPQSASAHKADEPAWVAIQGNSIAPGWKVGDRASWEEQLRNRAQGQNEYVKTTR